MKNPKILLVVACLALACSPAFAGSYTFDTAPGATDSIGDPVNATVTFITGAGTISITLTDLLVNPKDVGQLLSDLSFAVSNGMTSAATLSSSSGVERTVNSNGTFSDGGAVAAGWVLSAPSAGNLHLDVLSGPGHAGPAHLIIGDPGSATYSGANNSITGNGPHNPFLKNSATFNISLAGVTADSTISNVFFSFGTTTGDNVPGVPRTPVPDSGMTLILLGVALAAVEGSRRLLARRARS
jgi:hypothetical protein